MRRSAFLIAMALALAACGGDPAPPGPPGSDDTTSPAPGQVLEVTSSAFGDGEEIPVEFTCDGDDVSPPLLWAGAPDGTAEFAIVMFDPDAPGEGWVHWVLLHVPATVTSLDGGEVPPGVAEGQTSFGEPGYGGPCPPEGDDPHRYQTTVYALSRIIEASEGADYDDVTAQIEDAQLAAGTLEGTYAR